MVLPDLPAGVSCVPVAVDRGMVSPGNGQPGALYPSAATQRP